MTTRKQPEEAREDVELVATPDPTPGRVVLLNIGVHEPILRPAIVLSDEVSVYGESELHPFFSSLDFPLPAGLHLTQPHLSRSGNETTRGSEPTVFSRQGEALGEWRWPVLVLDDDRELDIPDDLD